MVNGIEREATYDNYTTFNSWNDISAKRADTLPDVKTQTPPQYVRDTTTCTTLHIALTLYIA